MSEFYIVYFEFKTKNRKSRFGFLHKTIHVKIKMATEEMIIELNIGFYLIKNFILSAVLVNHKQTWDNFDFLINGFKIYVGILNYFFYVNLLNLSILSVKLFFKN